MHTLFGVGTPREQSVTSSRRILLVVLASVMWEGFTLLTLLLADHRRTAATGASISSMPRMRRPISSKQ
jgi:hypothetical protein